MKKRDFVGVVLIFLFLLLVSCTKETEVFSSVPFEIIASGQYSGLTEKTYQLTNSQEELNSVWQKIYSIQIPPPPVPIIDFSQNSVILVARGEQKTSGYSIEIIKIEATSKEARVYLRLTSPLQEGILLPVLTQPFILVQTPKINKAVQFVEIDADK